MMLAVPLSEFYGPVTPLPNVAIIAMPGVFSEFYGPVTDGYEFDLETHCLTFYASPWLTWSSQTFQRYVHAAFLQGRFLISDAPLACMLMN